MQIFNSARLKLTLWYLAIIATISFSFSIVIYKLQTQEIARFEALQRERIETRIEQGMGLYQDGPRRNFIYIDSELIESVKKRILTTLLIFNGTVLFVSGILGYFLAGRTLEPIEMMLVEQERFVGDASHELRTPLTVLRTSLEVYSRSKNKNLAEANLLIDSSLKEVIRLQNLSDYLLELSRGREKISRVVLDLDTLVIDTLNNYLPLAKKKRITLTSKIGKIQVKADETTLKELLSILLDNAIKYTTSGGKIILEQKQVGKRIALSVKDTGIGISKADLPHIFDRFYRADSARTKGGYGLGLAIAKVIAKNHNGTLSATSSLNKGTTFTFTLPKV